MQGGRECDGGCRAGYLVLQVAGHGDGDGVGDACDPCPTRVEPDPDGDLLCGPDDNCPDEANPGQGDRDGDGLGDACDFCPDLPGAPQDDEDGDRVGHVTSSWRGPRGELRVSGIVHDEKMIERVKSGHSLPGWRSR